MVLVYSSFFECHVIHLKKTQKEMKVIKLGDIMVINSKHYIVVKWYYYYITIKPISKLKLFLNKFLNFK